MNARGVTSNNARHDLCLSISFSAELPNPPPTLESRQLDMNRSETVDKKKLTVNTNTLKTNKKERYTPTENLKKRGIPPRIKGGGDFLVLFRCFICPASSSHSTLESRAHLVSTVRSQCREIRTGARCEKACLTWHAWGCETFVYCAFWFHTQRLDYHRVRVHVENIGADWITWRTHRLAELRPRVFTRREACIFVVCYGMPAI